MNTEDYVIEMKRQDCMHSPPLNFGFGLYSTKPTWKLKYSILKENWKYFVIPNIRLYNPLDLSKKDGHGPIFRLIEIIKIVYYGTKSAIFLK